MPTRKHPGAKTHDHPELDTRVRALALGQAIRELREARGFSRAELLDRFYTQLAQAGIEYNVKGDWWLHGIENGAKAKELSREYIEAFVRALSCTKLETVRVLILADRNALPTNPDNSHAAGLTYVLTEVFATALNELETRIDAATAVRLDEHEWMEIGRAVLDVVAAGLERTQPD